jgi:hypothetical protein
MLLLRQYLNFFYTLVQKKKKSIYALETSHVLSEHFILSKATIHKIAILASSHTVNYHFLEELLLLLLQVAVLLSEIV